MGLLGVFRALYDVDDLKMNIKFEVEVLCKNLGLRLEDVPKSGYADLSKRVSPVKERNPDFNLKASSAVATPSWTQNTASLIIGMRTRFETNPAASLTSTGTFPRSSESWRTVS